jgi:hypothetical protein
VLAMPSAGAMILVATQPPVQNHPQDDPPNAGDMMLDALSPSYYAPPPVQGSGLQTQNGQSQETEHPPEPAPASGGAMKGGGKGGVNTGKNTGTIYVVPGSGTTSGKPYVGRHNKPNPAQTRRSHDGRDRTKAKVVRTYPANNTQAGRSAEQKEIDKRGLNNLDNKRNEIAK